MSYFGIVEKGSALDQPNALLGCVYYVCAFLSDVLRFIPYRQELMFAASLFTSVRQRRRRATLPMPTLTLVARCGCQLLAFYLGYLLIFVLGDFCIVCASTYVMNWATLWAAWGAMKRAQARRARVALKKQG